MEKTNQESQIILNIAAGKIFPEELPEDFFLVNLDKMYYTTASPELLESEYHSWLKGGKKGRRVCYINQDCFDFLSRSIIQFDRIVIYRFLEHVKRTDVLYFIYLLSSAIVPGGKVEVIVPDYKLLAERILQEDVNSKDFDKEDIITTTELVNEPDSPHSSIWTVDRVKYFFEYEGRFKIVQLVTPYLFDSRDIYLKFVVERT